MPERLYAEHPGLYDAINADWNYDRDVAFVDDRAAAHGLDGGRLLELGCGTGEHTRRFAAAGYDVTAVDPHEAAIEMARGKCDATIHRDALPELDDDDGTYDVVVMLRGVINHLSPSDLDPALAAIADRLSDGGLVVFDNAPLPPDGNHPAIDIGATGLGEYALIAQHVPVGERRLDWRMLVLTPDGEWIVDSSRLTAFADDRIASALTDAGFEVDRFAGFDPGNGAARASDDDAATTSETEQSPEDERSVFVGVM